MFTVIKPKSTLYSGPVGQIGYTDSVALGWGPNIQNTKICCAFFSDWISLF